MPKYFPILAIVLLFASCDYFKQEESKTPIARVNNSFLYQEDVVGLVSENTSSEDSTLIVGNYINRWATQQLLIDRAVFNLPKDKQDAYEKLVAEYKADLFTEAYKNAIVSKELDSVILESQYAEFYDQNKENFKLNDELVKVRYIHVDNNYSNLADLKEKFRRFNEEDKEALKSTSIQFISANFNDSIWVKREALFDALPAVTNNSSEVLKKSNFAQLQDSLGVYLVKIEDVLKPNDIAPLSFIKPTIEQVILNKRKLELIRKLEKDITKDAIKNKNFETYSNQ